MTSALRGAGPSSTDAEPARLAHVGALDGLRGLAVVAVVAFHAGHLRGGFLGVDLFFVLSGFLITALLVVEHESTGRISLRMFWARRARRLLPAMFAAVAGGSAVAAAVFRPDELARFRLDALAALGYVANWRAIQRENDYWALFDQPSPLEHLWSLAIEEQFYVLWPLVVVVALAATNGRRWLLGAVIALGGWVSLIALQVHGDAAGGTSRAYYGTDTRIASILAGAGLALWYTRRPGAVLDAGDLSATQSSSGPGDMPAVAAVDALPAGAHSERTRTDRFLLAAVGPALVGMTGLWVVADGTDRWLYDWGLPAHAALSVVVIAGVGAAATQRSATGVVPVVVRALRLRWLRHLGAVSYGLYLWHWPVFVVLDAERTGLEGVGLTATRVGVALALTEASYHLLEQPIRLSRWSAVRRPAVAVAALLATGAFVVGVTDRRAPEPVITASESGLGAAPNVGAGAPAGTLDDPSDVDAPRPGLGSLLVVGDSGADALGPSLRAVGDASGIDVVAAGQVGCGIVRAGPGVVAPDGTRFDDPEGCHDWPERWSELVEQHDPDAVLVVLSWGGVGDRDLGDGTRRGPCDTVFDDHYVDELRLAIETLGSGGRTVAVATVAPHGFDRTGDDRVDCLNESQRSAVDAAPHAHLVDLAGWVCRASECRAGPDSLRPDGIHLAGDGAVEAAQWLVTEVTGLLEVTDLPRVVIAGDSQAFQLGRNPPDPNQAGFTVTSIAALGCGLRTTDVVLRGTAVRKDNCVAIADGWASRIAEIQPDVVLVHAGVWESFDVPGDDELVYPSDSWQADLERAVEAGLATLQGDHELVVLTTPCFAEGAGTAALGLDDLAARVGAFNDALVSAAAAVGARVVDYAGLLCPGGSASDVLDGVTARPDGVHLDAAGARAVWRWLMPRIGPVGG